MEDETKRPEMSPNPTSQPDFTTLSNELYNTNKQIPLSQVLKSNHFRSSWYNLEVMLYRHFPVRMIIGFVHTSLCVALLVPTVIGMPINIALKYFLQTFLGISPSNNKSQHPAPQPKIADRSSLRICTMNLYFWYDRFWLRRPMIIETLKSFNSDIICIQEGQYGLGDEHTPTLIREINPNFDVKINCILDSAEKSFPLAKSVLFRKLVRIHNWMNARIFSGYMQSVLWTMLVDANSFVNFLTYILWGAAGSLGWCMGFMDTHVTHHDILALDGFRLAQRGLYSVRCVVDDSIRRIWVFNLHLSAEFEGMYGGLQGKQISQVLSWIESSCEEALCDGVIVCGDFNAKPTGIVYQKMKESGFKSAMFEVHGHEKLTHETPTFLRVPDNLRTLPPVCLDYVFYRGKLAVKNVQLIGKNYVRFDGADVFPSDHFGICADFDFVVDI